MSIREALEAALALAGDVGATEKAQMFAAALRELDEAQPVAWIVEDENFRQLSFDPAFREGTIRTTPLYAAQPAPTVEQRVMEAFDDAIRDTRYVACEREIERLSKRVAAILRGGEHG